MGKTRIPENYSSKLTLYQTQKAIEIIKRVFLEKLCGALNLMRVSAPLFVDRNSGLNDNLSGTERPVTFDILNAGACAEVVHSLAKWKRLALYNYGFGEFEGLCTDMNAIRRDEILDNLHSVYTDQWDWELVITPEARNAAFLKETVRRETDAICDTLEELRKIFPQLTLELRRDVSFVTAQELEDAFPRLTPEQREDAYLRERGTAFIMQIGGRLRSGKPHGARAPDYDDWSLNGDIMFYDELLGRAIEISSMGIRVDPQTLRSQLAEAGALERLKYPFHRMLLEGRLPLTIGGGIGQSRLCMLLLQKAHIGEVQVSVWDSETLEACAAAGIKLL